MGDVTGRIALTPVAIREGHSFADTVFGAQPRCVDHSLIASAVYLRPHELGTIGLTEEEAAENAEARKNPRFFANPEILWTSDELYTYEEGCLSIPEYFDKVERPARVRIRYLNRDGQSVEEEAEGLYAVCIQHEMDHLNGVLFIDHLSRLKRDRAVTKVKKAARDRIAA